ncbi:MAG: homogentisate 1,2-dioxygenase, partial [Deltaproteobacteria bacterium RIFCSPHIGHO2_02_FULL_40_11]
MAKDEFQYVSGFLNHFSVEAEKGALPQGQNNPQKPPYGLYAEQLSGTSFTSPRHLNLRTWLYRIRPSVMHTPFIRVQDSGKLRSAPFNEAAASPNQLRWDPVPFDQEEKDFSQNLITLAGSGDTVAGWGCAAHVYSISKSMEQKCFYNADGDFLIVPQVGTLKVQTEFGWMAIHPGQIGVIQRGMKFRVWVTEKSRGYVCENYGAHFRLPELGPIGANGLANPRDFLTPVAAYEDQDQDFELLCKFQGRVWKASMKHNPFDVVAWHGNYVPYVYDLKNFNVMGTVSFDHPDPSIFTVLTSPSSDPGVSNIDFVIFPDRWMVAENTFRPPYYHRNR